MKKVMKQALLGAPVGAMIYVLFLLLVSNLRGDGELHVGYYLIRIYGTELNALTAACISAMVLGMIWSAASLIFQKDWSLLKQTVFHYLVCTVPSLLIVYEMGFMPRNPDSYMQYLGLFGIIYLAIWTVRFFAMKKRVRQMNLMLEERNEG